MKNRIPFLILLFSFSFTAFATEQAEIVARLKAAKDPQVSADERNKSLQAGIDFLRNKIKAKYPSENMDELMKDTTKKGEDFRLKLLKCEGADCSIRELYTHVNGLASVMMTESLFKKCDKNFDPGWLGKQAIVTEVLNSQKEYDPVCEGATTYHHFSLLQQQSDGKYFESPLVLSKNAGSLINNVDVAVRSFTLEEQFKLFGKPFPKYSEVKNKMTDGEYALLKRKEQLKEEAYHRAILNAVSTKLMMQIHFGTKGFGELMTPENLNKELVSACVHCDKVMRETIAKKIKNQLDARVPETLKKGKRDQTVIAAGLCRKLDKHGYFDHLKQKPALATEDFQPGHGYVVFSKSKSKIPWIQVGPQTLKGVQEKTKCDTCYQDQVRDATRKDLRLRTDAIAEIAQENEDGLLFLSDAMTEKNEQFEAVRTNLGCTFQSIDQDANKVESALQDQLSKLNKHLAGINKEVAPVNFAEPVSKLQLMQDWDLKYLVKQNPRAVGEALTEYPNASSDVCDALAAAIYDQLWDNTRKAMITTAAVTASVLTAGIASVPLAILGNLAIGAAITGDQLLEKETKKQEFFDFEKAFLASGGKSSYSKAEMQKAYQDWQDLKFGVIDVLGFVPDLGDVLSLLKTYHSIGAIKEVLKLGPNNPRAKALIAKLHKPAEVSGSLTAKQLTTDLRVAREDLRLARNLNDPARIEQLEKQVRELEARKMADLSGRRPGTVEDLESVKMVSTPHDKIDLLADPDYKKLILEHTDKAEQDVAVEMLTLLKKYNKKNMSKQQIIDEFLKYTRQCQ